MSDEPTSMKFAYDGTVYEVPIGGMNANEALALRRVTGMSFQQLLNLGPDQWDIDVIAAAVWLARRAAGEPRLSYADVARTITYDSVRVHLSDAEAEPPEDNS